MGLSKETLVEWYRLMLTIRHFEEAVMDLYRRALMPGLAHLYTGEEAVAVGACAALRLDDWITSTHRGHGHCIAKGGDIKKMMAEIMGKETGYNRGKGGSMHIADLDLGILGAFAIVGGGFGSATGAALAEKMHGTDRVTVCFFGDGASNQGSFHENLNLAGVWKLPVVYVCENNLYAISVAQWRAQPIKDIAVRAASYGMPGVVVDGQDVVAVYEAVREAVERARSGEGPTLIECKTYRYTGHGVSDPGTAYRTQEEIDEWKERDPLILFRERLEAEGMMTEEEAQSVEAEVERAIEEAVEFARKSPFPSLEEIDQHVYA